MENRASVDVQIYALFSNSSGSCQEYETTIRRKEVRLLSMQ